MHFNHGHPIYLQIKEELYRRVVRGNLEPGEKAPSLRDLALELGVNPNTVQRAYHELETEGIFFTRRGQGTFVTKDAVAVSRLRDKLAEAEARTFLQGTLSLGLSGDEIIVLLHELMEEEEGI